MLKQTRGLSGAEFVLTDRHGALEAASLGEVDLASLPKTVTPRDQMQLGQGVELGGHAYFHTAITLRPRGAQSDSRLLHILYPQSVLREARWQAAYPPLWVGAGLLGVVIAMAFAIAGRLSRPILEVRRELGRLVQGDFQPVPLAQRNDELRDLIGCVNTLGDQLDELRRVIKRSERLALLGQLSGGLAHQLRNSVAGADRRATPSAPLRPNRSGQPGRGAAATSHDRAALAALPDRRTNDRHPPRRLRFAQIVADVVSLVGAYLPPPQCRFAVRCRGAPCPLSADAEQLRQLVLNLALNALEAAGSDGWVRIELAQTAAATSIRVLDSGPGPASHVAERLFEPFATGKPEGIGLGLTVARKIVESHGGTIRCTTGGATTFEVDVAGLGVASKRQIDHQRCQACQRPVAPAGAIET